MTLRRTSFAVLSTLLLSSSYAEFRIAHDGCFSGTNNLTSQCLDTSIARAATRCCDPSGESASVCFSLCNLGEALYADARQACLDLGADLCPISSLEFGECCGDECGFDSTLVWTNEVCDSGEPDPNQCVSTLPTFVSPVQGSLITFDVSVTGDRAVYLQKFSTCVNFVGVGLTTPVEVWLTKKRTSQEAHFGDFSGWTRVGTVLVSSTPTPPPNGCTEVELDIGLNFFLAPGSTQGVMLRSPNQPILEFADAMGDAGDGGNWSPSNPFVRLRAGYAGANGQFTFQRGPLHRPIGSVCFALEQAPSYIDSLRDRVNLNANTMRDWLDERLDSQDASLASVLNLLGEISQRLNTVEGVCAGGTLCGTCDELQTDVNGGCDVDEIRTCVCALNANCCDGPGGMGFWGPSCVDLAVNQCECVQ